MWGRKKPAPPGEPVSLDEQIRRTRLLVAGTAAPEIVGDLVTLLTVRATLAGREDRYDDQAEDLRAAAGLLRGFDGQPTPVTPATARLTWMSLTVAERREGRLDRAVEAAGRAVTAGDLVPADAELCGAFVLDLDGLRKDLRSAGRRPEAGLVAGLTSDLAARLAELDEPRFGGLLGASLVNEAGARANAGDIEAAEAVNDEAIRLLQERAPTAAALTVALKNRAEWERRTGQWEEAILTERRLVEGVRAEQRVDEGDRQAEISRLNSLVITYVRAGRPEDAEQTISEAITIARQAVASDPAKRSTLAMLLGNQANIRGELGRHEDALSSSEEALSLRDRLATENPSPTTAEGLAMVLNNHSVVLRRLGRLAEAADAAARSVELRRRNADPASANSVALLANSLNSHAEHLGRLGEGEQAVVLALEAQDLFAGLPAPGATKPYLRSNQQTLGMVLAVAGRHDEAVAAAQRAVDIGRAAADEAPGETRELASCLETLAERLTEANRAAEAGAARAEVAQLRAGTAS